MILIVSYFFMRVLYLIPARGGSKGVFQKNIKLLAGKPLICYSIDIARSLTTDDNICVSTDDMQIIKVVQDYGLNVPFVRPIHLATDTATTNDVLQHAIHFYNLHGIIYDVVVLLQPTSPLRKSFHVKEALDLFNNDLEMVVSVRESHASNVLCKENKAGFLDNIINLDGVRRQDCEKYYEYNGAIYIINVETLKEKSLNSFRRKKKYIMDSISSIDIDSNNDFIIAELLLSLNE
jgi:CMP-N,N'-diacetyllegionaminic acid synthase